MSVFSSVISALEVGWQQSHAVPAGLKTLRETGNPILAVRAYAVSAGDALEATVADEVEEGIRTGLEWISAAVVALEAVSGLAGDIGYTASMVKTTIRGWVKDAGP